MMTQVEIKNPSGAYIRLPLGDYSSGYVVEEIGGLDPVKATLVSSTFAELDGAQYNSGRRETRNITIKLGLVPNYTSTTIQSLRQRLYSYVMPKMPVILTFFDSDGSQRIIKGIVEGFDSPLFVEVPEINISIICYDPDFTDNLTNSVTMSSDYRDLPTNLTYIGTVPTGIVLTYQPTASQVNNFTIKNIGVDGVIQQMDYNSPIVVNNTLTLSTVVGNKYATLNASGQISSTLYAISSNSVWITLLPGTNQFDVISQTSNGAAQNYTLSWTNRYGGI